MKTNELQLLVRELAGPRTDEGPAIRRRLVELEGKEFPVLNRVLEPDERILLFEIAGQIEARPTIEGAWDAVEDIYLLLPQDRLTERSLVMRTAVKSLHQHTVAFIDHKESEVASGVLVSLNKRCFVATVAHALPSPLDRSRFQFVGMTLQDNSRPSPIVGAWKSRNEIPDVGAIEIDPSYAMDVLGKVPISADRLRIAGTGDPSRTAYVVGFPSELVTQELPRAGFTDSLFQVIGFPNAPLAPSDWIAVPDSDELSRPAKNADIVIPYPMQDDMAFCGYLPKPKGLSGGGVWQGPSKDELWSPDKYALIGLQYGWPARGRYIQATQIVNWLMLLREQVPSIRDAIDPLLD